MGHRALYQPPFRLVLELKESGVLLLTTNIWTGLTIQLYPPQHCTLSFNFSLAVELIHHGRPVSVHKLPRKSSYLLHDTQWGHSDFH